MSQKNVAAILDKLICFIRQVESAIHPAKYNLDHLNILAVEFDYAPKDFMQSTC